MKTTRPGCEWALRPIVWTVPGTRRAVLALSVFNGQIETVDAFEQWFEADDLTARDAAIVAARTWARERGYLPTPDPEEAPAP